MIKKMQILIWLLMAQVPNSHREVELQGLAALPNGNKRPCADGPGAPIFISIRRESQRGVYFLHRASYMCIFPQAKAPF